MNLRHGNVWRICMISLGGVESLHISRLHESLHISDMESLIIKFVYASYGS